MKVLAEMEGRGQTQGGSRVNPRREKCKIASIMLRGNLSFPRNCRLLLLQSASATTYATMCAARAYNLMKSATNVLLLSQPSLLNVLLCFGDTTLVTFVGVWVLSEIKLSRALWPEVLFVVTLPKSGRWEWVLECAVWVRVREAALGRRLPALTRSRSFVAFEKPLSKLVTYCTGGTSKRVTHGITAIKCTILLVGVFTSSLAWSISVVRLAEYCLVLTHTFFG